MWVISWIFGLFTGSENGDYSAARVRDEEDEEEEDEEDEEDEESPEQ